MFYAIHNEDGRITQANKVFDPSGYDHLLNDLGLSYAKRDCGHILPPDLWFVVNSQLRERPIMPVTVSATAIRAGGNDAVVLRGCPRGCRYQVSTGGVTPWAGTLDGEELEIAMDVPCLFRITLDLWPFRTFAVDIEAVP